MLDSCEQLERLTNKNNSQRRHGPQENSQLNAKHTQQRKFFHPITIPETLPTQLHTDEPPSWTLKINDEQLFRQEDMQLWPVHVTLTAIKNTPNSTSSHTETSTAPLTREPPKHTMKRNGDTEKEQSTPQEDLAQNHDKDEEYSTSEDDTALYYRAYSRHKPDIDESNAESTEHTQHIERDFNRLKRQRQAKRDQRRQNTLRRRIPTLATPHTPPTHIARTAPSRTHSEGEHDDSNELTDNAFAHPLDTEHCLHH